jgi:hypothetical protein
MLAKLDSFKHRGYPYRILKHWLLQESCWKEKTFKRERERKLKRKLRERINRIIPLKLQYTPRS